MKKNEVVRDKCLCEMAVRALQSHKRGVVVGMKAGQWHAMCGYITVTLWYQGQQMLVLKRDGESWTGRVDIGWQSMADAKGHNSVYKLACKMCDFAVVFGVPVVQGLKDPREPAEPAVQTPAPAFRERSMQEHFCLNPVKPRDAEAVYAEMGRLTVEYQRRMRELLEEVKRHD